LREKGCTYAQGFFITRPLPATELVHWLLEWSTRHLPRSTPVAVAPDDARTLTGRLPMPLPFNPPESVGPR
jgi:hypothetical protein